MSDDNRATVEWCLANGWQHWESPHYLHPCGRDDYGPLSGIDMVVTRDGLKLRVEVDVLNPSEELLRRLMEVFR